MGAQGDACDTHAMPFFVIMLIFVAIALAVAQAQVKATRRMWTAVGDDLDLRLETRGWSGHDRLSGEIDSIDVEVWVYSRGAGKSRSTYTGYRVSHRPSGPPVTFRRQGALSFLRRITGGRDVAVGDPTFDDEVIVDSDDDEAIAAFLTPSRRAAILSTMGTWRGAVITNSSIEVSLSGRTRSEQTLRSTIRRLVDTALVLTDPEKLDRALEQRTEGDLHSGVDALHDINDESPNVFTEMLEAEALVGAGQHEEAEGILASVAERIPDDSEVEGLRRLASKPAPAPPTVSEPGLGWRALMEDLFAEGRRGYEVIEHFETNHLGRTVEWEGEVSRVREFRFDADFDGGPGVKATVELGSLDPDRPLSTDVEAIVRLPDGTRVDHGDRLEFTGRLMQVDRFSRAVYVDTE